MTTKADKKVEQSPPETPQIDKRKPGRPKHSRNWGKRIPVKAGGENGNGNALSHASAKLKKRAFLAALSQVGLVLEACRMVDLSPSTVYHVWRKKENFAEAMDRAIEEGEDRVRLECHEEVKKRAFNKNDGMLYFLTKRHDPRFRDNAPAVNIHTTGPTGIKIVMDDGSDHKIQGSDALKE